MSMFGWLDRSLGVDHGLAKVVKVGDRVRHVNSGWGKVLEVRPQPDGTAELKIEYEREYERTHYNPPHSWWATYHIEEYEPGTGAA